MTDKKKAVKTIDQAHGAVGNVGRGICSLTSLRASDLAMTGSHDGYLRLWKVSLASFLAMLISDIILIFISCR
jgi:hypothetical protein